MKIVGALLIVSCISLSAHSQSSSSTPNNWGATKGGVRVSFSLDKLEYSVGEEIPLHIAAQVVSAEHPVYGVPDMLAGKFFLRWDFARAFHLTILDEDGDVVGNDSRSNLYFVVGGSSGAWVCPVPLEVGRVYTLEQTVDRKRKLLPPRPGAYRLIVTWSPYPTTVPPCRATEEEPVPEGAPSFVTVSSEPITIHVS